MVKPILMALVTLIAVHVLTRSWYIAGCISLIPLLLGLLNVLVNVGYSVTAFSLIAAVIWTLMTPTTKLHVAKVAQSVWSDFTHSAEADGQTAHDGDKRGKS
jgi:hypothetical protein